MKLVSARGLALKVVDAISAHCARIEIAGSIRRERAEVNDIDLVLIPNDMPAIIERVKRTCTIIKLGPQNVIARFQNDFQLDLFIAHSGAADLLAPVPSNWGSLLLCRTGSTSHNIRIVEHAKTMRMIWHPYVGVVDETGVVVASETEEAIYETLKLDWKEPRERN